MVQSRTDRQGWQPAWFSRLHADFIEGIHFVHQRTVAVVVAAGSAVASPAVAAPVADAVADAVAPAEVAADVAGADAMAGVDSAADAHSAGDAADADSVGDVAGADSADDSAGDVVDADLTAGVADAAFCQHWVQGVAGQPFGVADVPHHRSPVRHRRGLVSVALENAREAGAGTGRQDYWH